MGKFVIENNPVKPENYHISTWKKGKLDLKKFYDVKLSRKHNVLSFLFGILLTILVILPFALILIQFFKAYYYNLSLKMLFLIIAWVIIWFCNGLSNAFTIEIAKKYFEEEPKLQKIDSFAVFIYETFNPGFIFFTFVILVFLFLGLAR